MTGNELTVKIIKISKTSAKNNSETITNKEEIIRETYEFRKKRQQIINDLRLIYSSNNGISKNTTLIR